MKNKAQLILSIITVLLLTVNGLLIFQNLDLKARLEKLSPKEVKQGDALANLKIKDLTGKTEELNFKNSSQKVVLLYFNSSCGYCRKQMPYWKELASKADDEKYRVIAITTDENTDLIKKYLDNYQANSWNVYTIERKAAQEAAFTGTPITLVVDNKGTVEKSWVGLWLGDELADAGKYFNIDFAQRVALAK